MAYFSNGTEGMDYEEKYCSKCVHRDGPDGKSGCPVWLAHLLFAYDECNNKSNAKAILDILIPMKEPEHFAAQCSMFTPATPELKEEDILPSLVDWAKDRGLIKT